MTVLIAASSYPRGDAGKMESVSFHGSTVKEQEATVTNATRKCAVMCKEKILHRVNEHGAGAQRLLKVPHWNFSTLVWTRS